MKISTDVIVAGLGAMGSAALYQLAKRGINAIGIDQYTPPHVLGSSHGETRIFRQVTGQAVEYTPLALRAHDIWRELEHETGQKLLTVTGGLIVEDEGSSVQNQSKYLSTVMEAAKTHSISHEVLSNADLVKRFPQFTFHDNEIGYFERDAGILRPEHCVQAQLSLAQKMGAQVNFNERVLKFAPASDGSVSVTTDKGEYEAQSLIVSTGPWMSGFFPLYENLFKVCRQVLYWFDIPADVTPYLPGTLPVFIFEQPDTTAFYGFPAVDGPRGGLKLATENFTVPTTPDKVDRTVTDREVIDMYRRFVRPRMPGVGEDCLKSVACLYTVTPDHNFVIDTVPGAPQIVIASPCSGHGFKYSAAIGEALAELVLKQPTSVNTDLFRLARLLPKPRP